MNRPTLHMARLEERALAPCAVVLMMLIVAACRAQDATGPSVRAELTDAYVETAPTTNAVDSLRDPFWPVGYEPEPPEVAMAREEAAARPEVENVIAWPALQLRGLTKTPSGSYMALIHGLGWVEKGDTVKCVNKSIVYKWIVKDVGEQGVRCDRIDATPLSELRKENAEADNARIASPEQ